MKRILFYIFIPVILITSACTEDLDADYKGKTTERLIVDGKITNDTMRHKVVLSRTIDNETEGTAYETGADVTIWDSTDLFVLEEIEPGVYATDEDFHGIIGKTYSLNITTKDGEEYEAVSHMYPISKIDSIKVKKEYFGFASMNFYKVYFFGKEPPESNQYYFWNLYLNDSLYNDTIDKAVFESDEFVNGDTLQNLDLFWLEESEMPGDTIKFELEMLSIPEEYFIYLIEVMSETSWRGSPWDPTPANMSTNISNGAVGFFVAMAGTRQSTVYIKDDE